MSKPRVIHYVEFDVKPIGNSKTEHVVRLIGDGYPLGIDLARGAPMGSVSYRTFVRQEYTAPDGEVLVGERRDVSSNLRLPSLADLTADIFGAENKKTCDYNNIDFIKGEYFTTRDREKELMDSKYVAVREAEEMERRRMDRIDDSIRKEWEEEIRRMEKIEAFDKIRQSKSFWIDYK